MWEIKQLYDELVETYDDIFGNLFFDIYDIVTWKYIEPYLPKGHDAIILDAGGGTGRWATRIARNGYKVVLADFSVGMLNKAKHRIAEGGLMGRIALTNADIRTLSFPDETFDFILCEHALFLFKDPNIVIRELQRVLKKKVLRLSFHHVTNISLH